MICLYENVYILKFAFSLKSDLEIRSVCIGLAYS